MKNKFKSILMISVLAVAGIFGVSSALIHKQVEETPVVEKVDAATSNYPNKMYLNVYNGDNSPGKYISGSTSVQIHAWSGSNSVDITGISNGSIGVTIGYTFLFDSAYQGWEYKLVIRKGGGDGWSGNSKYLPQSSSNVRWIIWYNDWGIDVSSMNDLNRGYGVDNGSTTCTMSGEYGGKAGETVSRAFSATVANVPSGKVAALGQYSDATCTSLVSTFTLTNNVKTFAGGTFVFNSNYYFKPILYDTVQVSLNGGSTWNDLGCSDPTSSTRTYTKNSVSMTSGNEVQFRVGGVRIYPAINTYSHNLRTSGESYYIQDTNSGNIAISYSSSTYTISTFGARNNQSSGFYVVNTTNGDLYNMVWFETSGNKKMRINSDTTAGRFRYLSSGTKLYLMNATGSANNYYSVSGLITNSEGSLVGGYVVISTSAYYYIELQSYSYEDNYNKLYLQNYSATITYNANGHGTAPSSQEVIKGVPFDSPSAPTATGYSFGGWYKEAGCTNAWDFSKDTTDSNKTLYAKWTANSYTVTLNQQSGSGGTTSVSATYNSAMPSGKAAPTRTGYTFGGYYQNTGGSGTQYYDASMNSVHVWDQATNTSIYAKWTAKVLTLTLNNQEATSGGSTAIYLKYNTDYYKEAGCTNQITTSANNITVPTKSNCTFGGYWTGVGGTGTQVLTATGYLISDSLSKTLFSANGTLYAKWTFTIAYNANSGSGSTSSTTLTYGVAGSLNTNAFTAPGGHIFGTWNTNSTGSGTNYNSGASLTASQVTTLANSSTRTLYAKWTSGEAAAITFATNFNNAIGSICSSYNTNDKSSFIEEWNGNQESAYEDLAAYQIYWLGVGRSSNEEIIEMIGNNSTIRGKYDYVLTKYGYGTGASNLHDFMGRTPSKSAISNFTPYDLFGSEDGMSTAIIIVSSSIALLSITALSILVIKKRKSKEQE